MIINKKTTALLVAGLSVFALASCGKNTKNVVTFYVPENNVTFDSVKKTFEDQNPGWTLNVQAFDGNTQYTGKYDGISQNLTKNISSSKFDVSLALGYMDTAADLVDSGKLLNVDEYLDQTLISRINPTFYSETVISGNNGHYGVPFVKSTEALFVNEYALNELYTSTNQLTDWKNDITTWEGIYKICGIINSQKNSSGIYSNWYAIGVDSTNFLIDKASQGADGNANPTGYLDPSKGIDDGLLAFNTPEIKTWLGELQTNGQKLIYDDKGQGVSAVKTTELMNNSYKTADGSFTMNNAENTRGCFMALVSTSNGKRFDDLDNFLEGQQQVEEKDKLGIGVYDVPSFNNIASGTSGAQDATRGQGPSIMMFKSTKYKNNDKIEMAKKVVDILLSQDVQVDYAKTNSYVPATTDASNAIKEDTSFFAQDTVKSNTMLQAIERLFDEQTKVIITPAIKKAQIIQTSIRDYVVIPVLTGTNPEEAMQKCIDEIKSKY